MCHVLDRVKVEFLLVKSQALISNRALRCHEQIQKIMWWRILTFCVLVSIIIFVVFSCIHGRPVLKLFFHTCDDKHEMELFDFKNNFLRERLVRNNFTDPDSSAQIEEELDEILDKVSNVHNLESRLKALEEHALGDRNVDEMVSEYVSDDKVLYNVHNGLIIGVDFVEGTENDTNFNLKADNDYESTKLLRHFEDLHDPRKQESHRDESIIVPQTYIEKNKTVNVNDRNVSSSMIVEQKLMKLAPYSSTKVEIVNEGENAKKISYTTENNLLTNNNNLIISSTANAESIETTAIISNNKQILNLNITELQKYQDSSKQTQENNIEKFSMIENLSTQSTTKIDSDIFNESTTENYDIIDIKFAISDNDTTDTLEALAKNITDDSLLIELNDTQSVDETTTNENIETTFKFSETKISNHGLNESPFQNVLRKVLDEMNEPTLNDESAGSTVNTREAVENPFQNKLRQVLSDLVDYEPSSSSVLDKYSWLKQPLR